MNWSRDFMIMPELSSVRLRTEIGGLQCRRAHSARLHRLCINALWFDLAKKRGAVVSPRFAVLLLTVSLVFLWSPLTLAAVRVSFSLESPAGGPFPSDLFTVADPSHNTGLRVNLPKPNCTVRPSDCADLDVINTLDGFNVQPQLSIPFSGPIDVNTVTSETVFLVSLGSTLPGDDPGGQLIGINQVVWDPATNTLLAESDELLDQHTRYALIVTNGVHDSVGDPVGASEAFARFRYDLNFGQTEDPALKAYRKALLDALQAAGEAGIRSTDIVAVSGFTTQSVTALLEKIRDQLKADIPAPADFLLGAGGTRTVFPLSDVTGITFNQQVRTTPTFSASAVPLVALDGIAPGAVGELAFGKCLSPDYETDGKFIHVYLPVVDSAVVGANDFAHALDSSAKGPMAQEATNVDSSFISPNFQVNQAISGMEQCWTIKAVVAGEKGRLPQSMKQRNDLLMVLHPQVAYFFTDAPGNGPAMHAGVPALEQ